MKDINVEAYADCPKIFVDKIDRNQFDVWQMLISNMRGNISEDKKHQRYNFSVPLTIGGKKSFRSFSYHPNGYGPNSFKDKKKAMDALLDHQYWLNFYHDLIPNQYLIIDDEDENEKCVLITLKYGNEFEVTRNTVMLISFEDLCIFEGRSFTDLTTDDGLHVYARILIECVNGTTKYERVHRYMFPGLREEDKPDHQNHNGLDNRRANLVPGSNEDNMKNRVINSNANISNNPLMCVRFIKGDIWEVRNLKEISEHNAYFSVSHFDDDKEKALVAALKHRISFMIQHKNANGLEPSWNVTRSNIQSADPDYILQKVLERRQNFIASKQSGASSSTDTQ